MSNFLQKSHAYFATWKMRVLFAFSLVVLISTFFIPAKIGENVNQDVFLIKHIEKYNQEIDNSLKRVTSFYAAIKIASVLPKTFKEAGALGRQIGSFLQPIVEQLDRISSVVFVAWLALLVQKILMGFTSSVAINYLIPIGIVMYWLGVWLGGSLRRIGRFLIQFGVLVLLFVPTTAYINHQIIKSYKQDIDKMEQNLEEFNSNINTEQGVENLKQTQEVVTPNEKQGESEGSQNPVEVENQTSWEWAKKGFQTFLGAPNEKQGESEGSQNPVEVENQTSWEWAKEWLQTGLGAPKKLMKMTKEIILGVKQYGQEQMEAIAKNIENMFDQIMTTIALFVLTGIFVPIGVCFVFWAIFRAINIPDTQDFMRDIEGVIKSKKSHFN